MIERKFNRRQRPSWQGASLRLLSDWFGVTLTPPSAPSVPGVDVGR